MHSDKFMQTHKRSIIAHLPGIRLEQYMNTARVSLCLAILLSWTLASPVLAQQMVPGQTSVGGYPQDFDQEVDDIHTRSIFDNRNVIDAAPHVRRTNRSPDERLQVRIV